MSESEESTQSAVRAPRPCYGREAELRELERALEIALVERGQLYLLVGEPGIGKTRLCDELSGRAQALGVRVLWGRCWEAGGAPAYFPWREPLAALAASLDPARLAHELGDACGALFELVPALRAQLNAGARAGGGSLAGSSDPEQARFALFLAVASLVRSAAAQPGLLLVLDDLHAADESSLQLLCFLARELRGTRALVVATFRDVEARLSPELAPLLDRLAREGSSLPLARLGPEASARLLEQRAGAQSGDVHAEVFRRTQGNPLFLEHMAQLLRKQGAAELARSALPSGVRELIRAHLAKVSSATHALLEVAAISGDELEPAAVADAAGLAEPQARALFEEALDAGLLVARARDRLRFSHALVREVLERDLDAERRSALHGALAHVLEQRAASAAGPEPREPAHALLAHHGLLGPAAGHERAARHALLAARRAFALFAFDGASALLERALAGVPEPCALRCDLLIASGEAQIRAGQGSAGQATCLRAVELARALPDPERLARAALTFGLEITAALVHAQLVALLQEALAALPVADTQLRVQVSARLAAAMQPHHDLQIPIDLANQAIASARRIGDPGTLLDALYLGMAAMMDIVDPRERMPLNLEIEQLAEQAGEREKLLRTQARLVFDQLELGDLASADARISAFERLARELGAPRYLWRVPLFRSLRALVHGRFAEAEAFVAESRALGATAGDPQFERCIVLHHEGLLRAAERHEAMIAFDPEARRMRAALYSGPHWQNGGSAFTYARTEDLDSARLYLSLVPQDDWPLVQNPPAFMHLGEPLALIGERDAVQSLYAQLSPARHRTISWGWTKQLWDGTATRVLGLLAARLQRWDEADAHFGAALATLERMDARPYLARTRYEYARALLVRGGASHVERARGLLDGAAELAQALGLSGLLRLCDRRSRALPAAIAPSAAIATIGSARTAVAAEPQRPVPQLTCEGEYWSIAYQGATVRLRDSLGLQYLARLLAEPGRELHVLELSGGAARDESIAIDRGDAGELLDDTAKQRYRARLQALREDEAEAEARGDAAAATRVQQEIEFLAAELARAVGLGGRTRRAGAASERARSAVQRRIRNAIERIREVSPTLAAELERTVRTGTVCVYRS